MATARKCDRCGKYFDENAIRRTVENYNSPPLPVDYLRVIACMDNRGSTIGADRYDLCDNCWENFFLWMDVWKDDEEVESEPYKEYDTNCDMCGYLPKCVQECNVMRSTTTYDMNVHYVRCVGCKCYKGVEDE